MTPPLHSAWARHEHEEEEPAPVAALPTHALSLASRVAGLAVFGAWAAAWGAALGVSVLAGMHPTVAWAALLLLLTYEPAVGAVLLLCGRPASSAPSADLPSLSVLIAAYDERACIVASVRSVLARATADTEILVGDDGSTDGTLDELRRAFALHATGDEWRDGAGQLRVVRLPHRGKGATLNSLLARARHEVVVTVDADTELLPHALERIARPFADPRVGSAAGAVVLRNGPASVLTRFQYNEYLKNTFVRLGWSALGGLDQVPGAFGALRRQLLVEAGGFPVDSLVEDYEVTFRMQTVARRDARPLVVLTVPDAVALTDGPSSLRGLLRQRTRWFAGFLSTLFKFRRLIARPGTGAFGGVRLPLKLVDAVLPPLAWASLLTLVFAPFALGWSALLGRAAWDAIFYVVVARRTVAIDVLRQPVRRSLRWALPLALIEGATYTWLRQLLVLRAYWWIVRGRARWEGSRS